MELHSEVREECIQLPSHEALLDYRRELFAPVPWVDQGVRMYCIDELVHNRWVWALYADVPEGRIIIDYRELPWLPEGEPMSVREWIRRFRPSVWNDLPMVIPLYHVTLHAGPAFTVRPTEWHPLPTVDRLLASTRGALLWSHQLWEILRLAGIPDKQCVVPIGSGIEKGDSEVMTRIAAFEIDGHPLPEILRERFVLGRTIWGPDFEGARRLAPWFSVGAA